MIAEDLNNEQSGKIPADCFKPDESGELRRGTITVDESAVAVLDIQALESMLEKDLARQ